MAEGIGGIVERHILLGEHTRRGVKALGLELFADEAHASNTVTAAKVPDGVDGGELNKMMREEYGVVLAGGQGKLAGQIFRIGHLGWVNTDELDATFDALRQALARLGFQVPEAAQAN